MTDIEIDELINALEAARKNGVDDDPAAMTVRKLCAITGYSEATTTRRLRALIEAGRVVCVRIPFTRIDGARTHIPAYKLTGATYDEAFAD
ncbi:hypothetical protein [Thauera sp.]|uniref:hypothetical protein n=1 Tax=Thauera sp. TaxID=1905334 RepID=UPI002B751654|nr:hypothetical protein [Thauera sp.]HRP26669.1 winged helix-turn-helix transcriptional regulator [Thauera sp.]